MSPGCPLGTKRGGERKGEKSKGEGREGKTLEGDRDREAGTVLSALHWDLMRTPARAASSPF